MPTMPRAEPVPKLGSPDDRLMQSAKHLLDRLCPRFRIGHIFDAEVDGLERLLEHALGSPSRISFNLRVLEKELAHRLDELLARSDG